MEVKLDAETEKLVQKEIEAGRFPNAAALVDTALQHYFIARAFGEEYTREEIDEKISRGLTQLEAGEGVDGEDFFEQLKKRGQEIRLRSK
jgi:Arc/MetJ-type ribon-helix-helix transcriptional regulator